MSRWFRFYEDALTDPKVQCLEPDVFKTWVNLLCIASKMGGKLPVIHELSYLLSSRSDKITRHVNELVRRGLLDLVDDCFEPHNWLGRQYKSDSSTERVRKHRAEKRNVPETVPVTPPENRVQNTETEKNISRAVAVATRPIASEKFLEFWKAYPRRQGANPKHPAQKKFEALVKSGTPPDAIIAAARAYADDEKKLEHLGTPFVAQAVTWLNQKRFEDYQRHANSAAPPPNLSPEQRAAWVRERMREERENDGGIRTISKPADGDRLLLEGGNAVRPHELGRH